MGILASVSNLALTLIDKTGYAGIFTLSLLESAAIPIPSEVVIPFSGFLAFLGRFGIWSVVLVATIANLTGSLILYYIGKRGGRWILEHYGKYILIHKRDIERADEWFQRHGVRAVFFGRMLPVVRTFISLPAGIAQMDVYKFSIYTFFGALPWNVVLVLVGYRAGSNWGFLHEYFRKLDIFIIVLIGVAVVWYIWRHLKIKVKND